MTKSNPDLSNINIGLSYIVGIDIGTSGTKAIACTLHGKVLHSAYESYQSSAPNAGEYELDPDVLFNSVVEVLSRVFIGIDSKAQLLAISFSAAMHGLMAVDESGLPLTALMTWADMRSKAQAYRIKQSEVGKRIYKHTGTPIHPMSPLCKIAWLHEEAPSIFIKAHKFISIKEYVWFKLFGKYQIDYSLASATGLFDIYSMVWYAESLEVAGINSAQLSEVVAPTYAAYILQEPWSKVWNLQPGTPFIIGASDGCLANLGTGAIAPGDMAITIGTSGAVRMISHKPAADPKERIFNYLLSDALYVSGGPSNNGGIVVKWFIDNFMVKHSGLDTNFDQLMNQAEHIEAGAAGLIFLPYLLGERAPVWDVNAKAVFFGIQPIHTINHFLRAVIEGITFSLYQIGLSVEETIGPAGKIFVSGGFTHCSWWLQLMADIFNKEVCLTNTADASAIGAGFMGFYAIGYLQTLQEVKTFISVVQSHFPDPLANTTHMKNYKIFSQLYAAVKDIYLLQKQ